MKTLRLGDPLDKCIYVGAVVDPVQHAEITRMVASAKNCTVHQTAVNMPAKGCFFPPTLIEGLSPADPLMQEEIFGPVLVSTTFRTPAEAVELANNTRYGLAATLWTENVNLALDISNSAAAWFGSTPICSTPLPPAADAKAALAAKVASRADGYTKPTGAGHAETSCGL